MTPLGASLPPDTPPIDFTRLTEITEGDADFERELLSTFLRDVDERIELIADAIAGHDFGVVILEGHNLKGAATNMGALPLRSFTEQCEMAARQSRTSECRAALEGMRTEFANLQAVIGDHLA